MRVTKNELDIIKQQQTEFQDLVDDSNRSELGQCAKLLAMYVSIYKQRYGDIPVDSFIKISETSAIDRELSQIVQNGIEEASTMLRLVRDEQRQEQRLFNYYPANDTIN